MLRNCWSVMFNLPPGTYLSNNPSYPESLYLFSHFLAVVGLTLSLCATSYDDSSSSTIILIPRSFLCTLGFFSFLYNLLNSSAVFLVLSTSSCFIISIIVTSSLELVLEPCLKSPREGIKRTILRDINAN